MTKTKLVGVRLPRHDMNVIEERAKEAAGDKSAALRYLLELGIKQYKLEKAIQLYRSGKVSLGKASDISEVPVGELMDILADRGTPSNMTTEDLRSGLKNIEKVFKIKI